MTAFAMTEPEAGSDVGGDRHHRPARGIGLRPRRREDADLQRRHRRSLRRVRLHRPGQGRQGDQLLPGAGRRARAPVRAAAGAERPASAGRDRVRRLPGAGRRAARRRGTRLRARPRDARPAAAHGGRRGLRDGRPGARRSAGAREAAAPVRRRRWRSSSWCSRSSPAWRPISTAARLLTYRAAYEKDQGQERITSEAAMAKSFATEMAQRAVDDAVQLVGGRGVLAESPGGPALPRGAGAPDLRGDDGDPAADHRGGAAQAELGGGAKCRSTSLSFSRKSPPLVVLVSPPDCRPISSSRSGAGSACWRCCSWPGLPWIRPSSSSPGPRAGSRALRSCPRP